jgi:hypothetical protein
MGMDDDLKVLSRHQLIEEVTRVPAGVRKHRDNSDMICAGIIPSSRACFPNASNPTSPCRARRSAYAVASRSGAVWKGSCLTQRQLTLNLKVTEEWRSGLAVTCLSTDGFRSAPNIVWRSDVGR